MKNRYYILIALMTMAFVSCDEETLYDGPCKVRFVASVQDEVSVTRANDNEYSSFTPSAGFDAGLFVSYETTAGTPTAPGYTISWTGNAFSTSLALETGDYNFYGYAPKTDNASFDNTNKTLTIRDIPGLSEKDMLVIKPCSTEVESKDIGKNKTVSLQMDHLMAKVTPQFSINSEYNKLRDIRIKKIEFFFESAPTYTATVTYTVDSYSVAWKSDGTSAKTAVIAFSDANNSKNLTTTAAAYGHCYIVPDQDISSLKMKVTYDVYDKQQQLVRPDATAENTVKIKVSSATLTKLESGKNYKLNIQIIPTYLYVLSDNDESSVLVINDK